MSIAVSMETAAKDALELQRRAVDSDMIPKAKDRSVTGVGNHHMMQITAGLRTKTAENVTNMGT